MAKKTTSTVALTSELMKDIKTQAGIIQDLIPAKIEMPEYPDRGVKYDSYCKILQSGDKYKLLNLFPYVRYQNDSIAAGGDTLAIPLSHAFQLYLTDLYITVYGATAGDVLELDIPVSNNLTSAIVGTILLGTTQQLHIEFKAPIRIPFKPELPLTTEDIIVDVAHALTLLVSYVGWAESTPT